MQNLISQLIQIAALAIGTLIARRLTKPSAHDRAQHLALVAKDVVNLVLARNPNTPWGELLSLAVAGIAAAAGLDVTDQAAIERAAAAALNERGVSPHQP